MTTKEIQKYDEERLPMPMPVYSTEMDDDDMDDMEIPRLRLLQPMSPECVDGDSKPGTFVIDGVDTVPDPLIVAPLAFAKFRAYRNPDDWEDVFCVSDDAKIGRGQKEGYPGGDCTTCPFQNDCTLIRSFNVAIHEPGARSPIPARWDLAKSGRFTANRLIRYAKTKGLGNFAVVLNVEKAVNKRVGATYFVPNVRELPIPEGMLRDPAQAEMVVDVETGELVSA